MTRSFSFDTTTSDIIVTAFVHPPIPMRQFDWEATRRSYEPGGLIGRGPTEQAAIDDLLAQESDEFDD